ncbi:MAG: ABC transporter ATP-binding protein [Patescibacteria group bacterium]
MNKNDLFIASQESTKIPHSPLRFLLYMGSKYKFLGIVSFLLVLGAEIFNILIFYVSAELVDNFTLATDLQSQKEILLFWGSLFLGVTALNSVLYRISGFTAIYWVIKFHKEGYNELYDYLTRHSHTYFSNRFAGSLSNKVSNAMDSSAGLMFQILWTFFSELIGLIVTLGIFFSIDMRIGFVLLVVFMVVLAFNIYAVKKRRPFVVAYAAAASKTRGEGVDVISNVSAVRQYAQRNFELQRLAHIFTERAQKDVKQSFFGEWIMVANTFASIFMTALVLVLLYILLGEGEVTTGTLVLVLGLLGRVGYMFITTGQALNRFIREYGNIEEGLKEILIDHEIVDVNNAAQLQVGKGGSIVWKEVDFNFDSNPAAVFSKFNLTIPAGQRVGLVGASGAGKSTFVSLLLRQHEVTGGAILIDEQNIATVTQDSLRSTIAVVPQEPALFHRSIRENIVYGKPDATHDEVVAVAKKAQAHDFIVSLPEGYETLVGERGVKLSGGQKQRVAIARAMLKDAPILILDEATSALDSESEVEIQKALHVLMSGKTVIAVAHRLSTLREMDRIIVLQEGKIIEDGTHETLKDAGGIYAKLWNHQAGGFIID